MMLENFINRVNGQVVSSDNVPLNAGESVQLLAEWCKAIGLPFQWSQPAYWWDETDEALMEHWERMPVKVREGGVNPRPGDIVLFSSSLPGTSGAGHGSIFLGITGENSWDGLDSNWGGKSVHRQSHSWAYVVGWLTPKNPSVLEAPIATPIAESTTYAPYEVEKIPAKIVTAKHQPTILYNLSDVSYDSMLQNPLGYVALGFEITVTAIAHHRLGGDFYMPDPQKAEGYLTADCDEYEPIIAPTDPTSVLDNEIEQQEIRKTDYIPSTVFPPLRSPNMSDMVTVPHKVPYYTSMSDAFAGRNSYGQLTPTKYYVYKRSPNGMLSLTSQPGMSMRTWINPKDLETPPEEEVAVRQEAGQKPRFDWEKAFVQFAQPRWYVAREHDSVFDWDEKRKPIKIRQGQQISVSGFMVDDNVTYAVPTITYEAGQHYVIEMDNLRRKLPEPTPAPTAEQSTADVIYERQRALPEPSTFVKLILRLRAILK